MVSYHNPPELPSSPYYSHSAATEGGRLVFIAGQAPLDAQGQLVGRGDFRKQAEQVFANLQKALHAAGVEASDIVSLDTYYINRADLLVYAEARQSFFAERKVPPTSTTIQVAGLVTDGALLEVGAIAVAPGRFERTEAVKPITVMATLHAHAGCGDTLERELLANAEKSRGEPGCLRYDLHRGLDDRDVFALYETWRSRETLASHFEMPYMKDFAARRDEFIERYEMNVLQHLQ